MAAIFGTVTFWISAFIPREVVGYTQTIQGGPYSGLTAVPLPKLARLHPMNTSKQVGTGYLGDQRGFSEKMSAAVRMRSTLEVNLWPPRIASVSHTTSGTTEVNIDSGMVTAKANADLSGCFVSGLEWYLTNSNGRVTKSHGVSENDLLGNTYMILCQVYGEGSDPLVAGSANIDYDGLLRIFVEPEKSQVRVVWDGAVDGFPAYEAYAQFKNVRKTIFTWMPPVGNTVLNLVELSGPADFGRGSFPSISETE